MRKFPVIIVACLLGSTAFCQSFNCMDAYKQLLELSRTQGSAEGRAAVAQMLDNHRVGGQRWTDYNTQYSLAISAAQSSIKALLPEFESNCLK
jgi:hypothetical protein